MCLHVNPLEETPDALSDNCRQDQLSVENISVLRTHGKKNNSCSVNRKTLKKVNVFAAIIQSNIQFSLTIQYSIQACNMKFCNLG